MSGGAPVEEQMRILGRGVVDFVSAVDLAKKLERSRREGRPLRVKLGIDPSSPDIHVGHTVVARKLRQFQDLGHTAILLWGTATAMVGDPTGRNKTRPQLTREQVMANLATYRDQIGKVVDVDRAEHRENGEWFDEMRFQDVIRLCARTTVARMLERDSFTDRMRAQGAIGVHELLYPIMQGWDSVMLRADVELGGSDQLFNLLVGRDLQREEGQEPQVCMTLPLLEGLDGTQKMSKSLGNAIGVTDAPNDMFGKAMSIPDALMEKYFLLLTDLPEAEVRNVLASHPRAAKARLAEELTSWLHGPPAAAAARAEFDRVFREGALPSEIGEVTVPAGLLRDGKVLLAAVLVACGFEQTNSRARSLIEGGGVRVDGGVVADAKRVLGPGRYLVQSGKRKAAWCTVSGPDPQGAPTPTPPG